MSEVLDVPAVEVTTTDAVQTLGAHLKAAPEVQAFFQAALAIQRDAATQKVLRDMREHQTAMQWQTGDPAEHARALNELERELAAQPLYQTYHQAEQAVRELLIAVDAVISEAAGVEFAANAKRNCCGG
jgi:cell fate (sporulation/competence/biofilm development) regulator YlbF (YheA/YmcA/DUF963 family)